MISEIRLRPGHPDLAQGTEPQFPLQNLHRHGARDEEEKDQI